MAEPTDAELLRQWKDGDEDAGNVLVRRHFSTVFRFFRGALSGNVDDLTQGTFLACVEAADRWRGDSPFRAFLLGIARKQLLSHLRKQYRRDKVFDPEAQSVQHAVESGLGSPSGVIAGRDSERLLLAALRRIPVDFQIAVELFYWEEMPLKEIATVLDVAPGTVKSRLGRAREMLRAAMAELATDPNVAQATVENLEHWARSLKRKMLGSFD